MKDLVTTGTGNSRKLKSSIPAGTTWEEALAMLRDGTFPIDLNGLNAAGVSVAGSAYSKANVLPDALCTELGVSPSTAEPRDAFNALMERTDAVQANLTSFVDTIWPYPYKQGVSRPNILENWYFFGGGSYQAGRFPINQKATTSQTAIGWFIDRWRKANANGTTSLVTGGLVLTGTGSATCAINQPIEYSQKLLGKQVTASFLNSAGSIASATCTLPTSLPSSATTYATSPSIGGVTLWVRGNSSYFYVELGCSATSSNAVVAVKLELGPNQTLARQVGSTWVLNEIPHFATELMKCQRHMLVFPKVSAGTSASSKLEDIIGTAVYYDDYLYAMIPTPITMRAVPTISGLIYIHNISGTDTIETYSSSDLRGTFVKANAVSMIIYESQMISAPVITSGSTALILDANL